MKGLSPWRQLLLGVSLGFGVLALIVLPLAEPRLFGARWLRLRNPDLWIAIAATASIALLAATPFIGWWRKARRRRRFEELAARYRLGPPQPQRREARFAPLIASAFKPDHHRVHNLCLSTVKGWELGLFDLSMAHGAGRKKQHRRATAAIIRPPFPIPDFAIGPRGLLEKAFGVLGREAAFHAPGFTEAFSVLGEDDEAIQELLGSRLRQAMSRNPEARLWARGGQLLFVVNEHYRLRVKNLEAFLREAMRLANALAKDRPGSQPLPFEQVEAKRPRRKRRPPRKPAPR